MLGIRDAQPAVLVHHGNSVSLTGHTRRFTALVFVARTS